MIERHPYLAFYHFSGTYRMVCSRCTASQSLSVQSAEPPAIVKDDMSRRDGELGRFEVAKILEDFLQGSGGPWDWDDFTQGMAPLRDPGLEAIRARCAGLGVEFPPASSGRYCSEEGLRVLRSYISELRKPG